VKIAQWLSLSMAASLAFLAPLHSQTPTFSSTTNLQSIAVQVVDRKGNFVPGLTADDFTLLEDGRPQKIAFFGAQREPVSLAVLLDSSRSMDFGRKFDRARELLAPLIAAHRPEDQLFFAPFTDKVEPLKQTLTIPVPRRAPDITERGTALYDATASALCQMRAATNRRQAIVVITDGADQHSRLNLDQLLESARTSTPQIFMIGFFSSSDSRAFHEADKTITLVGEREIDNPLRVFERLSKESGAESFFPSSEQDLKKAIARITETLQAQYTLAYYPADPNRYRRIAVRVKGSGLQAIARSGVGASAPAGSSCEISAKDHPYPWESKITEKTPGERIYREDFADPKSGWPNHREQSGIGEYKPGLRYISGGYEISRHLPPNVPSSSLIRDGVVAAYGPSWTNVSTSVSVLANWYQVFIPQRRTPADISTLQPSEDGTFALAAGLVFHLNEDGYYAVVLTGNRARGIDAGRGVRFKLIRRLFDDDGEGKYTELIPWTPVAHSATPGTLRPNPVTDTHKLGVEYKDGDITVLVDDERQATVRDHRLLSGLAGMAVFGTGAATFHDLLAEPLH
jgi:Ca-activated chloride channel family protein